jgi:hypothetical protein
VIALVVPVWNDSTRLARFGPRLAEALAARALPVRWIIADDGSDPAEHGRLAALRDTLAAIYPAVEVHYAARHRGKGGVVREAWELAPEAAWLAFVDADGSVSASDMLDLIGSAMAAGQSTLAVRVNTATTRVEASLRRELLHHAYLWLARRLLGLHSADLQCGAKVIKAADYRRVAGTLREDGFAFDSELLLALHRNGCTWQEIPVNWHAEGHGKVKPLRDGLRMFAALRRLRNADFGTA